jgi:hypothetical protein
MNKSVFYLSLAILLTIVVVYLFTHLGSFPIFQTEEVKTRLIVSTDKSDYFCDSIKVESSETTLKYFNHGDIRKLLILQFEKISITPLRPSIPITTYLNKKYYISDSITIETESMYLWSKGEPRRVNWEDYTLIDIK